jgi:hypothetical protein
MKAAIKRSGSTPHHAAPSTKVSNAQEVSVANPDRFPTADLRAERGEGQVRAHFTECRDVNQWRKYAESARRQKMLASIATFVSAFALTKVQNP